MKLFLGTAIRCGACHNTNFDLLRHESLGPFVKCTCGNEGIAMAGSVTKAVPPTIIALKVRRKPV